MPERQFIEAMGGDKPYQEFRELLTESRSAVVISIAHLLNGSTADRGKYKRMRNVLTALNHRAIYIGAEMWVVMDVRTQFGMESDAWRLA